MKNFVIALLLVVGLTACEKDEVEDPVCVCTTECGVILQKWVSDQGQQMFEIRNNCTDNKKNVAVSLHNYFYHQPGDEFCVKGYEDTGW